MFSVRLNAENRRYREECVCLKNARKVLASSELLAKNIAKTLQNTSTIRHRQVLQTIPKAGMATPRLQAKQKEIPHGSAHAAMMSRPQIYFIHLIDFLTAQLCIRSRGAPPNAKKTQPRHL